MWRNSGDDAFAGDTHTHAEHAVKTQTADGTERATVRESRRLPGPTQMLRPKGRKHL